MSSPTRPIDPVTQAEREVPKPDALPSAVRPRVPRVALRGLLRNGVHRARRWLGFVSLRIARVASRSRFASAAYYFFLSSAFWREQRAVLSGRVMYERDANSGTSSPYLLRRNVHRLEKGLIMRPRREVFALDYIEETVECFHHQCAGGTAVMAVASPDELQWAEDVLARYFSAVDCHPTVDRARARYESSRRALHARVTEFAPFARDLEGAPPVSYEALLELARRRRSTRWFLPLPVERELIDKAVGVASLSPSACNRQPYRFHVFDDPADVGQVAAVPMGTVGFSENFPAVVVVTGRQRAYFSERDRHVIYIDASLAVMSFVLALETLGLSSCCINWPDVESRERTMAELLQLAPDERVIMLVAVGHPDPSGLVPYSQKMSLESARTYSGLRTAP